MTRSEIFELLRLKLQPENEPQAVRFIVGIHELADKLAGQADTIALLVVGAIKETARNTAAAGRVK